MHRRGKFVRDRTRRQQKPLTPPKDRPQPAAGWRREVTPTLTTWAWVSGNDRGEWPRNPSATQLPADRRTFTHRPDQWRLPTCRGVRATCCRGPPDVMAISSLTTSSPDCGRSHRQCAAVMELHPIRPFFVATAPTEKSDGLQWCHDHQVHPGLGCCGRQRLLRDTSITAPTNRLLLIGRVIRLGCQLT